MKAGYLLGVWLAAMAFCGGARAEKARIGVLQTAGAGPMYIALAKGYFARENIEAEVIPFDSAQPMAVSIAAGDLEFGATAFSAAFYNLAAQGLVRIIAAQGRDMPGFANNGLIATTAAWNKGVRAFPDIKGHVVGVATPGSGPHYALSRVADAFGFSMADMDVQFLKSSPNMMAAVASERVEAAIMPSSFALSLVGDGRARLIGWVGDIAPWQLGGAFTSTKNANERGDFVNRFLRGYRAGIHDYYDAFITPDARRRDGPAASEMLAIMSKALDQPAELLRAGITYADREARLDGRDIHRQVAWHRAQGLIERDVDVDAMLDKRYVVLLPE